MALPLAAGILAAKYTLSMLLLLVLYASPPACHAARNITAILAAYPDFGEFSSLLRSEGLADDISRRNDGPITVLAVNDTGMAWIKTMPREAIWGHLSLHVLLDCYYDAAKLQRLPLGGAAPLESTLFHAADHAPGAYGMVRIVKLPHARGVGFLPIADDVGGVGVGKSAFFVRSVYQAPGRISVLQVSGVMSTSPISQDAARGFKARRY